MWDMELRTPLVRSFKSVVGGASGPSATAQTSSDPTTTTTKNNNAATKAAPLKGSTSPASREQLDPHSRGRANGAHGNGVAADAKNRPNGAAPTDGSGAGAGGVNGEKGKKASGDDGGGVNDLVNSVWKDSGATAGVENGTDVNIVQTNVWSVGVPGSSPSSAGFQHSGPALSGDLSSQLQNNLQLNPLAQEFVPGNGHHMMQVQMQMQMQMQPAGQAGSQIHRSQGPGSRGGSHNRERGGSHRYDHSGRRQKGGESGYGQSNGQSRGRGGYGRGKGGSHKAGHKKGGPHNGNNTMRTNEDSIRRTVYICDIDNQVTEAQLAAVFIDSGPVIDCRVCGDPNSAMRFAFIEFEDEESAKNALVKNGTVLGLYNLRVLPSRTAIVPVNLQYLPRSYEEREQCGRTVYAANIDKKVDRNDVRAFFETLCGRVSKLRLLGDYQHATRIAFIEFFKAESAIAALNCSGALLGSLPIRVSPSKTPVRPDPREGSGGNQLVLGDFVPEATNEVDVGTPTEEDPAAPGAAGAAAVDGDAGDAGDAEDAGDGGAGVGEAPTPTSEA